MKIIRKGDLEKHFNELQMAEKLRQNADAIERKALESILKITDGNRTFYYGEDRFQIKYRFSPGVGRKVPHIAKSKAA